MGTRRLRVAAVQMDCRVGQVEHNLAQATRLVEEAARRGARLILLPELMPGGYALTEEIWECAEPLDGRITRRLRSLAARLDVYIGTTFLEADGEDFFNTFVLATAEGEIAGRVRKSPPASLEACFYRAGNDAHVLETALGRIGVGICYENLLYKRLADLYRASVDLVLQPMAAGRPNPFLPGDEERFDRMVARCAPHYARQLGVPVIFADRCGPLETKLPGGSSELVSLFPGLSAIADSDGSVRARLGQEEGVLVADVELEPGRKATEPPPRFRRRWAMVVPWYAPMWPLTQRMGERLYEQNERRRERARALSARQ